MGGGLGAAFHEKTTQSSEQAHLRCDTWTTGGAVGDCGLFDLDADGDVDLGDFNWFLSSCTGPAIP
jgi:hypothetical protein